ncbi:MAG: hypothetical protein RR144_02020 [Clostridia bacterium]
MKNITNKDIRNAMKESKVKYYQVADAIGIQDSNFSRLLRYELCDEYKQKIFKVIQEIKEEN